MLLTVALSLIFPILLFVPPSCASFTLSFVLFLRPLSGPSLRGENISPEDTRAKLYSIKYLHGKSAAIWNYIFGR
jgi:hypothetical protein